MDKNTILERIDDFFNEKGKDIIVTRRVKDGLCSVIDKKISLGDINNSTFEQDVYEFLSQKKTIDFVLRNQPNVSKVGPEVKESIIQYFEKELPKYQVRNIYRKSNSPEDYYLYSVVAEKQDGTYACWTSFNSETCSLNHGHYDINSREEAVECLKEYFYDSTGEMEKYGMEESGITLDQSNKEEKVQQNNVIPFRTRGRR